VAMVKRREAKKGENLEEKSIFAGSSEVLT
jgi:hypothetical protein